MNLEQIFEKCSTMKIRPHCGPGFDSASNRNFLGRRGVKASGKQGWPYHLHVPTVMKSDRFNLLEPSGPVQSCTRITLPFFFFSNGEGLCLLRGTDLMFVCNSGQFLALRYGGVMFCCQRHPAMSPGYVTFHASRRNAQRYVARPLQCDLFRSRISNCFNCMKRKNGC